MPKRNVITSDECEQCTHCSIEEIDRGNIYVYCGLKERKYFYGKYINCSDFTPKKEGED
jgi:hypothetical protein